MERILAMHCKVELALTLRIKKGKADKWYSFNLLKKERRSKEYFAPTLVREAGVEPARPCEHWHLKPASLPIPPLAQVVEQRCSLARWLCYHSHEQMSTFFYRFRRTNSVCLFFGNYLQLLLVYAILPGHYAWDCWFSAQCRKNFSVGGGYEAPRKIKLNF